MPTLHEIQTALQRSLMHRDEGRENAYIVSDSLSADDRLDIHRNGHAGNLSAVLRLAFPAVRALVGGDFFDGAAAIFIKDNYPVSSYLSSYGAGFPAFLRDFEPAATLRYLGDVADLEWAVHRAIHAPDVQPLALERIAAISPDDQGGIVFSCHPSVSLLRMTHPASDLWRAVLENDDRAMNAIDLRERPRWFIVERHDGDVRVTSLSKSAAQFFACLFTGEPLHVALEASGEDAAAYLADHFAHDRFVGLEVHRSQKQAPEPNGRRLS